MLQVTPEEHPIVAMSIIVGRDSDTIDLRISWQNRKAQASMKGDGTSFHRRSNSVYFGTSQLAHLQLSSLSSFHVPSSSAHLTARCEPAQAESDGDDEQRDEHTHRSYRGQLHDREPVQSQTTYSRTASNPQIEG